MKVYNLHICISIFTSLEKCILYTFLNTELNLITVPLRTQKQKTSKKTVHCFKRKINYKFGLIYNVNFILIKTDHHNIGLLNVLRE